MDNTTSATRPASEYGDQEQPKKRPRRSRKGLEKIFTCEEPGCNKRFTRAEHLSRHQLNHRPKEIFPCLFPGCTKTFVRADLRMRHAQRHEKNEVKIEEDHSEQLASAVHQAGPQTGPQTHTQPMIPHAQQQIPISQSIQPLCHDGLLPETSPIPVGHIPTTNMASVNTPIPSLGFLPQQPPPQPTFLPEMETTLPPINNTLLVNALDMDMRTKLHSRPAVPLKPWQPTDVPNPLPMFTFDQTTDLDLNAESSQLLSWLFGDASSLSEQFDSPTSFTVISPPSPAVEDWAISETKQQELLRVIPSVAEEPEIAYLSRYLHRFWDVFHPQVDVIHRGTFRVESTAAGLLWTMIALGAGLDGNQMFANKICHPLRWILFASPDCQPPARLWVFQALMILECYEKIYTDRTLHERGHVHHATTIQLMRRSSVFQGAIEDHFDYYDSPSSAYEQQIEVESFKRVAYFAFCLDVLHCVTLGHTPAVSTHEIRLQLPDEVLWSTSSDPGSTTAKPPAMFLSSLKRLLNRQHVDVRPFGRHVLLFGLMSVAIQMQQRDLQTSSIGWKSRKPWKEILARSYDFWADEFGIPNSTGPLPHLHPRRDIPNMGLSIGEFPPEFMASFSVTLLQQKQALRDALALSALHVYHLCSIVLYLSPHDFQIFAGVPRMLTVKIREAQYDACTVRINEWARTESGSMGAWHAIRILRDVYLDGPTELTYRGEIDPVIHRSHTVTLAVLILWVFAYVNAGCEDHALVNYMDPITRLTSEKGKITEKSSEMLTLSEERPINRYIPKEDGYRYLQRLCGYSPVEIRTAPNLQNIIGLLQLVWKSIEKVQWEAVQELSRLLQHCMERSRGKQQQRCDYMIVWRSR